MEITETKFKDLVVIDPRVFEDERGYFFESFNEGKFEALGLPTRFVQDNQSMSCKGTLRGLHFQATPFEQGKLVRVIRGAVLDVVVDIRKASASYGEHFAIRLDEHTKKMLWIPPGFAHGFVTLEDDTVFCYKCTGPYNKASEGGLLWNDPALNINWQTDNPIISEKDQVLPPLKQIKSPF